MLSTLIMPQLLYRFGSNSEIVSFSLKLYEGGEAILRKPMLPVPMLPNVYVSQTEMKTED